MKAKVKTLLRNIENGHIKTAMEIVLNEIKNNTPKQNEVYNMKILEGASTYELREKLGISHQTLTARLSDLTDEGLIKPVAQHIVNDRCYSVFMYIHDLEYRKRLVKQRKREKYLQWLKNANEYFEFMDHKTADLLSYEQQKEEL